MGSALQVYVMYECDMCQGAITDAPIFVQGNDEKFCTLHCCKIFYSKTTRWISRYRKEKR